MSVFRDLLMTIKNGGRLPSEYQEVEWIQSSGSQYIDTGFKPSGDTSIEFKISPTTTIHGVLYGAYNSNWNTGYGLYLNYNGASYYSDGVGQNNFWIHYYNNFILKNAYIKENSIIKVDKGKFYMDNVYYDWATNYSTGTVQPYTKKDFTLNYNMYIFCGNWYGSIKEPSKYKLYYL